MKTLSATQAVALLAFAARSGKRWKAELRTIWASCAYDAAGIGREEAALLQQVRNNFGPSWLDRVTMAQIRSASNPPEHVRAAEHDYHGADCDGACGWAGHKSDDKTDTKLFEKVTSDEVLS